MSNSQPIKSPAEWEVCDNTVIPARVKVFPFPGAERAAVVLGGIRLWVTLQEWRDVNDAVELGFSNLTHRPVPARTDKLVGGDAA